jgi:hypothetical protein
VAAVYRPLRLGVGGKRHRSRPRERNSARGATNLVGPTANLSAFVHGEAPGRINYNAPTEKSTTPGEGSNQLPRTVGNSRPRHSGVAEAAGHWRLNPTFCDLCSFLLKDCSVTSATVKRAFVRGGGIHPRRLGECGHDTAAAPGGGTVSRGSTNLVGPTTRLCGLSTRQGIGADHLPRTDRDK